MFKSILHPTLRLTAPALAALTLAGCAGLVKPPGTPMLPMSAGYPKEQAIALMLPTGASGFVQEAAEAIEAGYTAARKRDPKASITEETADTYGDGAAAKAYEEAAGADPRPLMVGPLLKGNVNAVADLRSATDPAMLALNEAEAAQRGLYQFALSPEDEAKTVAALVKELSATDENLDTVVVYPAEEPWAERMRRAFSIGIAPLKPSAEIAYAGGAGNLGDQLAAAGADLVFMLARPEDAARVYSAIRAADADLPVIATSHAADQVEDRADKKGIFYVDVPWLVDDERATEFQQRGADKPAAKYTKGQLGRLYAMGIDAYYLGAEVANNPSVPTALTLPSGMTGALSFAPQGRLMQRRLALGRIGSGGSLAASSLDELAAATEPSATAEADDEAAEDMSAEAEAAAEQETDEG